MEETQRFLRYVMPGALFLIEALVLLILLGWLDWTQLKNFADMKSGGAIAIVGVLVLGLGALGYLFSIIHHWTRESNWLGGFDHRQVIARLRRRGILMLVNARNGETLRAEDEPDRVHAWVIVNALWHERAENDPKIKGANPRVDTLSDKVHSIGAARVGAAFLYFVIFFALLVYVLLVYIFPQLQPKTNIMRFIIAAMIAFFFLYAYHRAYCQISDIAENLISEILEDALTESFWVSGGPVRTFVAL
jgi:hypothetical protein